MISSLQSAVCENIPSIHTNALQTPEIESSDSKVNSMLKTTYLGQEMFVREYPTVYWFKIYHNKNKKKGKPVYSSLVPSFFHKKLGTITIAELMP
ncbi:hypothetical protein bpmyx0001_57920 [Bacillus pseudomycoides DSM 12442]|nr:hypothetical protein bpmyx0001_57920 [Bacillus pseudomycoides DSM 12442]